MGLLNLSSLIFHRLALLTAIDWIGANCIEILKFSRRHEMNEGSISPHLQGLTFWSVETIADIDPPWFVVNFAGSVQKPYHPWWTHRSTD